MKRTLILLIAGLASIFALGACSGATDAATEGAEGVIESATGCKVDGNGDQADVECKNGNGSFSVGTGAELPDDFPEDDVPLPDGKIVSSVSTDINEKPSYNVTVEVDGSVDTAADDYQAELVDQGFALDNNSSFNLGGSGGLIAFKAESADWDVNVIGADGSTTGSNGLIVTVTEHEATSERS